MTKLSPLVVLLLVFSSLLFVNVENIYADTIIRGARINGANIGGVFPPPLLDQCTGTTASPTTPGQLCANGARYAGTFDPLDGGGVKKYMTTPSDAGEISWSTGERIITGATSTTDGAANTTNLKNRGAWYAAATTCNNLSYGGYTTGWYLPAQNELNLLFVNRVAIGGFDVSGNYPPGWYWSSTEIDSTGAWYQNFNSGDPSTLGKNGFCAVRCVRRY